MSTPPLTAGAHPEQTAPGFPALMDWPQLLARISGGEEAAFVCFYNHFFDRLFRYALVMARGDEQTARDLLQKTMLKVVRYAKPFPDEATVWSWLTQLAKTSFIDLLRSQKRAPEFVSLEVVDHVAQPPVESEDATLNSALEKALLRLAEDERQLVHSVYFDDLSHKQIAQATGVTPKAVESKLARTRQKLRALLTTFLNDHD